MIKTFPLRFTDEFHKALKEAAHEANISIHQYVIDAINSKMFYDKKEGK